MHSLAVQPEGCTRQEEKLTVYRSTGVASAQVEAFCPFCFTYKPMALGGLRATTNCGLPVFGQTCPGSSLARMRSGVRTPSGGWEPDHVRGGAPPVVGSAWRYTECRLLAPRGVPCGVDPRGQQDIKWISNYCSWLSHFYVYAGQDWCFLGAQHRYVATHRWGGTPSPYR